MVRPGHGVPLLTVVDRRQWHANGTREMLICRRTGGGERVSRRVGELASERIGGRTSRWSTQRLNDLDVRPPIRYASGAGVMGYPLP